jgi:hypothetical protein
MRCLKTAFRIKSGGKESTVVYKDPKVNGTAAMRCTHQAGAILDEVFGPAHLLSAEDQQFLDGCRSIWKAWASVADTITAMRPSEDQLKTFRADTFAMMVALQSTLPTEEWSAFYFHAVYAHADEFLSHLGSLGLYMNQGAESKHKEGCLAWVRCGCGCTQGRKGKTIRRTIHGIPIEAGDDGGEADANLDNAAAPQEPQCHEVDEEAAKRRRRTWKRSGLRGVVEGLLLLNFARSTRYCDRHDRQDCACQGTMGDCANDDAVESQTEDERTQIVGAVHDVTHLAHLRNDPDDSDAPSGVSAEECAEDWEEQSAAGVSHAENVPHERAPDSPVAKSCLSFG